MSEDIIRFADKERINNFTLLGHSMGARTAMTLYTMFSERIDGVISIDAAPVNEVDNLGFGSFTESVVRFFFLIYCLA